jgi:single-strand DNA-binding protein
MASMNKVQIIGYLGEDPKVTNLASGKQVCNISVATDEGYKDKRTNEWVEKTEWHRVVIWNEVFIKFANNYLKKGSQVYVEGKLATEKWEDREGVTRYTTKIILGPFDSKLLGLGKKGEENQSQPRPSPKTKTINEETEDEIPF